MVTNYNELTYVFIFSVFHTAFWDDKSSEPPSSDLRNCPSPTEHLAVNSNSLSSDSGLQTEKTSEMSSDDFDTKMDVNSPSDKTPLESTSPDCSSKIFGRGSSAFENLPRSRGGNVKDRMNIFLGNKEPNISPATSGRPSPKKRMIRS